MPAKNLTLYAKWNNVLSPDGTVTEFANVGDKAWIYDEQTGAYHSDYPGVSNFEDVSNKLPEFSVTLTSSGILSFDYLLKSNKAPADFTQDGLGYRFSPISVYYFYYGHLLDQNDLYFLNGSFAVTGDTWGKASIAIDVAEGESVTVYLAYAKMADEGTDADGLWIKNLKFSLADLHLTVDVNNAECGSVTAASGEQPLAIGSENSLPPSSEVTLTAAPNTGYKFYCWVDENNNTLSTKAEYKFSLINDMKITAVFGSEVETQYVAQIGKNFYPTLKAALDDAKAGDKLTLLKIMR